MNDTVSSWTGSKGNPERVQICYEILV